MTKADAEPISATNTENDRAIEMQRTSNESKMAEEEEQEDVIENKSLRMKTVGFVGIGEAERDGLLEGRGW